MSAPGLGERAIVTADPDFLDLALEEVVEATGWPATGPTLGPGVRLVGLPGSFWELAERWQAELPIFVRHVNPVQRCVNNPDLERLALTVERDFAELFDPELPFSVQTRIFGDFPLKPFDVNNRLAAVIREASAVPLDVRNPRQILSVVLARPQGQPSGYLGLSLAVHNLSDWAGGVRRFRREPEQISRAEFKLLEALEVFGVTLPPRGRALDLGAAPGGWTRVLREHEQYVTAVDPAELHPTLAEDAGVRRLSMTAEAYLEDDPDQYDLIVNDMRMDARDSARLMARYAPFLYRHGRAIMTLKLPQSGRRPVLDHSLNILRQAYRVAGARQLFHNRSEITVLLAPIA